MKRLVEFTLPVQGLKNGSHVFDWHIDSSFFGQFEGSPVTDGDIDAHLELDRRADMLVFDFEIEGTVRAECDRCLAEIDLPVDSRNQLVVKFSEHDEADGDDGDLVFIHPEASEFNVAAHIYEYIVLAMPLVKTLDGCEDEPDPPCDLEMLERLEASRPETSENPFRDALGGFTEN